MDLVLGLVFPGCLFICRIFINGREYPAVPVSILVISHLVGIDFQRHWFGTDIACRRLCLAKHIGAGRKRLRCVQIADCLQLIFLSTWALCLGIRVFFLSTWAL